MLCGILFIALQQLSPKARKWLIVVVTFIAGFYYTVEFFWPVHLVKGKEENPLTSYVDPVQDINQILTTLAIGLGIYSLMSLHAKNITRLKKGWGYSVAFFVSMFAMTVIGIASKEWAVDSKGVQAVYSILFKGILQSLDATMFSIIAFYIVSAAYRAFRIRSAEATLLMGTAFLVMLGQIYFGVVLTSWLPTEGLAGNLRVESISNWILTRVNAPAVRAIGFGLGVGLIATSLRIWLSLERGSYFDKEL